MREEEGGRGNMKAEMREEERRGRMIYNCQKSEFSYGSDFFPPEPPEGRNPTDILSPDF